MVTTGKGVTSVTEEETPGADRLIQEIFETKKVLGRSGVVHELHSAIDAEEGKLLSIIILDDPGILKTLEVGCAFGISSLYICSSLQGRPGASHTIIDFCQTGDWDGVGILNLERAGIDFFNLIEDKSEFVLPQLVKQAEGTFDLVFVDGWHTFDHTLLDCFYATRLLRVGGYLVLDDVTWPSIRRVAAFFQNYPCYKTHLAVTKRARKSWGKTFARTAMFPVPDKIRAKLLSNPLYHRIFDKQVASMVALKKISQDERKCDWHHNAF